MTTKFPAYSGKGRFAFVSYSHKDSEIVYPIIRTLHEMGYNIWYDEGIPLVAKYGSVLYRHIRECSVFLLFVSKNSVPSPEVDKEVENAFGFKKTVVRINIDDTPVRDSWAFHLTKTSQFTSIQEEPEVFYRKLKEALSICRGETPQREFYSPETANYEAIDKNSLPNSGALSGLSGDTANSGYMRAMIIIACLVLVIGVIALITSGVACANDRKNDLISDPPGGIVPPQGVVDEYDDSDESTPGKIYKAGDIIRLGSYEQDGDYSNGAEQLEWMVLEADGEKAMLLSLYAIDTKSYHANRDYERTWESCDLNTWLNTSFYNDAFTSAEKNMIVKSKISTPANPDYGTSGGSDSYDNVFILSAEEASRFFSKSERIAKPTKYIRIKENYPAEQDDVCWWWLRSTGKNGKKACYVDEFGYIGTEGNWINDAISVRPAIYIENGQ